MTGGLHDKAFREVQVGGHAFGTGGENPDAAEQESVDIQSRYTALQAQSIAIVERFGRPGSAAHSYCPQHLAFQVATDLNPQTVLEVCGEALQHCAGCIHGLFVQKESGTVQCADGAGQERRLHASGSHDARSAQASVDPRKTVNRQAGSGREAVEIGAREDRAFPLYNHIGPQEPELQTVAIIITLQVRCDAAKGGKCLDGSRSAVSVVVADAAGYSHDHTEG